MTFCAPLVAFGSQRPLVARSPPSTESVWHWAAALNAVTWEEQPRPSAAVWQLPKSVLLAFWQATLSQESSSQRMSCSSGAAQFVLPSVAAMQAAVFRYAFPAESTRRAPELYT